MPNPVVHFEILGKDPKRLQDFYAQIFDWKVDANNPMGYGVVEAETGGIGGGIGPTSLMVGHACFYVEVDDLDAYIKKAESLGGRRLAPPTEVPGMVTFALISDPEGNLVGLVKADSHH